MIGVAIEMEGTIQEDGGETKLKAVVGLRQNFGTEDSSYQVDAQVPNSQANPCRGKGDIVPS